MTERQGHAPATGREGEKEFRYFILRKNLILYKTWARRHEVLTKSFYGLIIGRSTVKERRKGSKRERGKESEKERKKEKARKAGGREKKVQKTRAILRM